MCAPTTGSVASTTGRLCSESMRTSIAPDPAEPSGGDGLKVADPLTVEVDDLTARPFHAHLDTVGVEHGADVAHGTDPRSRITECRFDDILPLVARRPAHPCPMDDLDHCYSSADSPITIPVHRVADQGRRSRRHQGGRRSAMDDVSVDIGPTQHDITGARRSTSPTR